MADADLHVGSEVPEILAVAWSLMIGLSSLVYISVRCAG